MSKTFDDCMKAVMQPSLDYGVNQAGSSYKEFLALLEKVRPNLLQMGVTFETADEDIPTIEFKTPLGVLTVSRELVCGDGYIEAVAVFRASPELPDRRGAVIAVVSLAAANGYWARPDGQPFPASTEGEYRKGGALECVIYAMATLLRLTTERYPVPKPCAGAAG